MKHIVFFIFLFFVKTLSAQKIMRPELMLCGNYSLATADISLKQGFGYGFGIGFLIANENKQWGIRLGLEFQHSKFSLRDTIYSLTILGDYYDHASVTYNCLRVPILFPMSLGSSHRLFLEPGVFAAFPFRSKWEGIGYTGDYTDMAGNQNTPGPKKSSVSFYPEVGFQLGFGVNIPLSTGVIGFRVDGSSGFYGGIHSHDEWAASGVRPNSCLRVSAIYRLP